ncbi:hypothetical protein E4H12_12330 [Candidatus Thorarchaeota archaeon]|nr:hypothetical protein [Candidatus Thorarchaeota archaeon]TFG95881.1 MAG: hypothetical protein E4H12_12330 [Candidatus Thorarchaeota archaeon]
MENLAFLKTKTFSRYYSIMTNAVLSLSIVFGLLGILGNLLFQSIAGFVVVLGVVLLFGQILLVLNNVNKSDRVGWILVRFAYMTMFVMILGMLSITVGTLIASFYLLGGNSLQAAILLSSIGLTSLASFGICFSGLCYHTHSIENVWIT